MVRLGCQKEHRNAINDLLRTFSILDGRTIHDISTHTIVILSHGIGDQNPYMTATSQSPQGLNTESTYASECESQICERVTDRI